MTQFRTTPPAAGDLIAYAQSPAGTDVRDIPMVCPRCNFVGTNFNVSPHRHWDRDDLSMWCPKCGWMDEAEWMTKETGGAT